MRQMNRTVGDRPKRCEDRQDKNMNGWHKSGNRRHKEVE